MSSAAVGIGALRVNVEQITSLFGPLFSQEKKLTAKYLIDIFQRGIFLKDKKKKKSEKSKLFALIVVP